jgi:uncharacterized membrane protein YqaE (UPF0057 family)
VTPSVSSLIFAVLLPPLGVFLRFGIGRLFWIDLVLTLFAWVPGMIFALVTVLRRPNAVQATS